MHRARAADNGLKKKLDTRSRHGACQHTIYALCFLKLFTSHSSLARALAAGCSARCSLLVVEAHVERRTRCKEEAHAEPEPGPRE